MLYRVITWMFGLFTAMSFLCTANAFNVDHFVYEVSSTPDTVYTFYLGQSYEDYSKELPKGVWECVANGLEGDARHPSALYFCERGPKVREKLYLVHDAEYGTLRKMKIIFSSDSEEKTKRLADSMYYNLLHLNMVLVEDRYDSKTPYAEWKMFGEDDNRRVRVAYVKPDVGVPEAVLLRYVKDNR